MRLVFLVGLIGTYTLGCGSGEGPPEVTRADADQAKADGDTSWICERYGAPRDCDICELLDWYGDGTCDDFCDTPDPDCACGGFAGLTCDDSEFCDFDDMVNCGFADQMGICRPRPVDCVIAEPDPVCGCDGETYASECHAHANGVDFASRGTCEGTTCPDPTDPAVQYLSQDPRECMAMIFECDEGEEGFTDECGCGCIEVDPTICGGLIGTACDDDEYCEFGEEANCGIADASGICRPRPWDCVYAAMDPVCGCDGVTYPSDCNAQANGVDFRSRGICEEEPGCRSTGCPDGEYCSFCWGAWECIPDDALC